MELFKILGKIAVDGVSKAASDLKSTTTEANKSSTALGKIGTAIKNAFGGNKTEAFGVSLEKLTTRVSTQENKVELLKKKYADLYLTQGKNSDEARKCAEEIEALSKELETNKSKLSEARKAADKFDASLKDSGKSSKETAKEFSDTFSKVGSAAKKGLAIVGGAIASAGTALLALSASTSEYRNEQAKLQTAFEAAGGSAESAKNTYNDLYRVLGDSDQAVEAANHLAKLTTNEQELSEWTNICQGIYATFGASLPIEGLTEAANETAKTGHLTGVLADAVNWAGVNEDAFQASLDACNTEAEREALIRETLNGLYSTAAAQYEVNNAAILAQNEAQAALDEQLAKLGETLQPVNTAFTQLASEVLAQLQPYIEDFAATYLPKITEALSNVGTVVGEVMSFIAENLEVISTVATIVLGIAAALSVFSTVMGVVNAVMAASPVTWIVLAIVAAISALVAIIVVCVKHLDEIKAKVDEACEGIKTAFAAVVDWFSQAISDIAQFFTGLWEGIKTVWDGICNVISFAVLLIASILDAAFQIITLPFRFIWENCKEYVFAAWEWIKEKVSAALNAVKEVIDNVWTAIVNFLSPILEKIKSVFSTVWNAIKNTISTVLNAIKSFISTIWGNIKTNITTIINGIKSTVSSVFNGIKSTVSNVFNSIKSVATSVWNGIKSAITTPVEKARDTVKGIIDKIKGFFNFSWSLPNLKLPHFSASGKFSLNPLSVPRFSISWYKNGGVLDEPTIFGSLGNTLLGGGEAGKEAVAPIDVLQGYVSDAVASQNTALVSVLEKILVAIETMDANMGGNMREAMDGVRFEMNKREFGRAVRAVT